MNINFTITVGVATLLANAKEKIPSGVYTFEGDMNQMAIALDEAQKLGLSAGAAGGYSYVYTKEDYDKVVKHLIDNEIEGYWLYNKG